MDKLNLFVVLVGQTLAVFVIYGICFRLWLLETEYLQRKLAIARLALKCSEPALLFEKDADRLAFLESWLDSELKAQRRFSCFYPKIFRKYFRDKGALAPELPGIKTGGSGKAD